MSVPLVTPEGTISTSSRSSVVSLIPENPQSLKKTLPKGRVFVHRLPRKTSFITATSDRYVYDDDFPSIAASDSTHACFPTWNTSRDTTTTTTNTSQDVDRASFRDRLRRMSKRGDCGDDSIIEDLRENGRHVGCAEFLTHWFAKKQRDLDLDPPICQSEPEYDDSEMFSIVGYDDFMHGGRRPSAAARVMARIRGS